MRKFVFGIAFFLLLAMPLTLLANGYGHGEGLSLKEKFFHKERFIQCNQTELGLKEDQIQAIKNLKYDLSRKMIEMNSKMELAMLDIQQELHNDKVNMDRLNALVDAKMETKKALCKDALKAYVDMMSILTAEQKAKMKELWRQQKKEGKMCKRSWKK
ncbi:MAG TPA: Spy/CpxP family protein refolding chaperone [Candidatus Omnitrophota bacterium]|nr:Spy/CpxP family protein refolding chaperone [Candidatus Omnitrophota bacterium]